MVQAPRRKHIELIRCPNTIEAYQSRSRTKIDHRVKGVGGIIPPLVIMNTRNMKAVDCFLSDAASRCSSTPKSHVE
ncbi:Uncharacterized protein HZ326_28136 [Fusarium oxysporum f. sp. albedinis]|nr:hypothetical protein HZ326_31553 [Fusarium oxysporum f. sp. albedinis]KAJ0128772.1 Uncharacterized protein HZ326_28136 [Fusarium oxysporum f. sp. albedinis]